MVKYTTFKPINEARFLGNSNPIWTTVLMLQNFIYCVWILFFTFPVFATETVYQAPSGNPAAQVTPRNDWFESVQQKFTRFGNKHFDIIFDGDSITDRWEVAGSEVWNQRYRSNSAEFGIAGDRVENVLWRLSKGQVDGINPKVVVLMIGTNNIGRNSVDQISEGIAVLIKEYEKRCPNAHIILMGVLPRGQYLSDLVRLQITELNSRISTLGDGIRVSYIDIGSRLVETNGSISQSMMPDFFHLSARGYEIWSDSIQTIIENYVNNPSLTADSALITFSGLCATNQSDGNTQLGQAPIPAKYQPLLNSSHGAKAIDGANISITITWNNATGSNHGANSGVTDHTGDNDSTDTTKGGGIMFGTSSYSMTFNKPIEIPSLFWSYYNAWKSTGTQASIAVYTNSNDDVPVKLVKLNYTDSSGYVWHELNDFSGIHISKITFDPGVESNGDFRALNIDDITVRRSNTP